MKSTVEHLNPTRVKLSVEVPFDELKPHFDKAYKALAGQVRIPGFRPGKVPAKILDARLGRGAVLSEVVNDAIPAKYGQAVSESSLQVISQPEIEVTKIEDGEVLEFTAEVDVRPEFDLPDASTISVEVDTYEISDTDVEEQVDSLRERFATVTTVERAAGENDTVTLDLTATVDGETVEDATTSGLTYRIGTGDLVDGLDDAITGRSAGEEATFTTKLVAGEHAGKDAEVTAKVLTVSERALPQVDDDFAQLASEFDTVEEMRTDLVERIRRVKNLEQGGQARDKVLEALLAATEIATPESVVKGEYDARQHDAVHSFDHNEDALNAYLEGEGQTREEFDAETREASEQAVRTQLLLDALADQQNVQVSQQEFTERVIYNAQRFGMAPDAYFARLQENNQLGAVIADVRRGKALANAVQQATVTDTAGAQLNVAELFGVEVVPEGEDLVAAAEAAAAEVDADEDVVDADADATDDDATDENKA